jgi:hypothetical protein
MSFRLSNVCLQRTYRNVRLIQGPTTPSRATTLDTQLSCQSPPFPLFAFPMSCAHAVEPEMQACAP